jgi:hypothetical protein
MIEERLSNSPTHRDDASSRLLHGYNILVSVALSFSICVLLFGRAWPTQATRAWLSVFLILFCLSQTWLTIFLVRLTRIARPGLVQTVVLMEAPLLVTSVAFTLATYISDQVNHQLTYFLQPTPAAIVVLVALITAASQRVVLQLNHLDPKSAIHEVLSRRQRWMVPSILLFIGLLQGSSYLWIVGSDFVRYWAVADAARMWGGYPATAHLPSYVEGGMYPYSIEVPGFPTLLMLSFALVGHDTLAAHLPALAANGALPLIAYAFFRRAGFESALSFTAACAMLLFPFLRLYTLNAPVPDAVFVALLTATGCVFLQLAGPGLRHRRDTDSSSRRAGRVASLLDSLFWSQASSAGYRSWALFGLLAGLTILTRPEGMMFVGAMLVALLPNILKQHLYLAGAILLALIAPFSLLMLSTFGIPWPRNPGSSFGLENIAGNLNWIGGMTLPFFADPFGLPYAAFVALVGMLAIAAMVGTLSIAVRRWQIAALPAVTLLHIFGVFTVDPRVSGVDQWFDFYRHLSYGTAFLMLPLLFVAQRLLVGIGSRMPGEISRAQLQTLASICLAFLLFAFSVFELHLLSQPSRTWGVGAKQLLTADVWMTFPDLVAHRYQLPQMPLARVNGVLMIDPKSEYMPKHLDTVRGFFEPYSSIKTGRGSQYEVSTLLFVLFGMVLVVGGGICGLVKPTRDD